MSYDATFDGTDPAANADTATVTEADADADTEAVDRVRAELRRLGSDADSAADVPAWVSARVAAALRDAPPPIGPHRRSPSPS